MDELGIQNKCKLNSGKAFLLAQDSREISPRVGLFL